MLGTGIDGVDGVIRPVMAALSAARAIWVVVMPRLVVILVVVVVVVAVLIITATVMVIVMMLVVSGAGNPFGFFSVGVSVCCLYQFADGCGPLAV